MLVVEILIKLYFHPNRPILLSMNKEKAIRTTEMRFYRRSSSKAALQNFYLVVPPEIRTLRAISH
jgi:hypothetical protein